MKQLKIVLIVLLITITGFLFWLYCQYAVPIIMYHHVKYSEKRDPNSVTPENFAWQMEFIKKNGYQVISLDELIEGIKTGRSFSRKSVVITFDDGYEDNYLYAFPTLKKLGITATMFIVSDLIGQKGYLTWEEVKTMQVPACCSGRPPCSITTSSKGKTQKPPVSLPPLQPD